MVEVNHVKTENDGRTPETEASTEAAKAEKMSYLLIALALAAVCQPGKSWRSGCCTFVWLTLAFDLTCANLPGEWYFLAASGVAAACADMLEPVEGSYPLQLLCLGAIALNLAGWGVYEAGGASTVYVLAFQFFYAFAILLFIFGGPTRADSTNTWHIPSLLRPTC